MSTRIAILQANSGIDPDANAAMLEEAVRTAKDEGAAMLFTPEMVGLLDQDRKRATASIATEEDSQVLARVREAAAAAGLWVHLGSLALDGGERWVNRSFVIDDQGEIRARYDKIHLFDIDLPTGESWRESAVYRPGDGAVVVPGTPVGTLGLAICYDLRFPALFERLSEAGADLFALPAAFTVPTGKAHWEVLLRARAIEAGRFLVAPAQVGRHADGRETYGHSLAIDPWGEVLVDMGDTVGVRCVDLDLAKIGEVEKRLPVQSHRRAIGAIGN